MSNNIVEGLFAIAAIAATVYLVVNNQPVPVRTAHERFEDEYHEMCCRCEYLRGATYVLVKAELNMIRRRYNSGRYTADRCISDLHFLKSMYF